MSPTTIIRDAQAEGVTLRLSPDGDTIKAAGDPHALTRWTPVIREHKAEIIKLLQEGQAVAGVRSKWWRLRMADGSTKEIASFPAVARDECLRDHPEAVDAEPFDPGARLPAAAFTDAEERAILGWCQAIEEGDPEGISAILAVELAETLTIVGLDDWLDAIERFQERAGIIEHDGQLPRPEAEALAWQSLLARRAAEMH